MPKYALLIYSDESQGATATQEEMQQVMTEYNEFTQAIINEGILRAGEALQPTMTAKTVQVREGQRVVTDGPFAETKEQLGGFYIVEAASEDQALEVATRLPGSKWGTVEVRPVMEFPEQG